MMAAKDERVKLFHELLSGIRVVKFYAWENHFERRIEELRARELKALKARKYLDALFVYFWATYDARPGGRFGICHFCYDGRYSDVGQSVYLHCTAQYAHQSTQRLSLGVGRTRRGLDFTQTSSKSHSTTRYGSKCLLQPSAARSSRCCCCDGPGGVLLETRRRKRIQTESHQFERPKGSVYWRCRSCW